MLSVSLQHLTIAIYNVFGVTFFAMPEPPFGVITAPFVLNLNMQLDTCKML